MAQLLYGDTLAEQMLQRLRRQKFTRKPRLVVIQVGDNAASATYIAEKEKAAEDIGIGFELLKFPRATPYKKLQRAIAEQTARRSITGIIVQLPLPNKTHAQEVLDSIPVEKDVDVLSSASFGQFALGKLAITPPTVRAILLLLSHYDVSLKGKLVVLVGAGRLVGLPTSIQLIHEKATICVANGYTKNLAVLTRQADILISGVGKPNIIRESMVKKGAVIIDAGTSGEKGKTRGDVDFDNVIRRAKAITPVPGGVGPLTVACLLENVVALSQRS